MFRLRPKSQGIISLANNFISSVRYLGPQPTLPSVVRGVEISLAYAPLNENKPTDFGGIGLITDIQSAPGETSGRLFVVTQAGTIWILRNSDQGASGQYDATPFLDIRTPVNSGGERGLLGLAFHPNYSGNGYFYVNYSNSSGGKQPFYF